MNNLTRSLLSLLFAAGCLALGASNAPAQSAEANIGVRTKVVDGWVHPKGKETADGGHSKVFGLLAVEEIKSDRRLVKPVDVPYMKGILLHELAAHGFRPFAKGQNPDILLTVSFGRGELTNPYIRDTGEVPGGGTTPFPVWGTPQPDAAVTSLQIVGTGEQLFEEMIPGFRQKMAKAKFEKLFIRVTAWEFPKSPTAKRKMLWKTVIVADDPDNRDLNALAADMLAAGAPYFDKETNEKEIDLYKPVPEGRVDVGTPVVVEPKK